jgi:hypothetical protein
MSTIGAARQVTVPIRVSLCVSVLAACGDGSDATERYVTERFDEDGVEVVMHRGTFPIIGRGWWISPEPHTEIRGESPVIGTLFGVPADDSVVPLLDGGIAAAHRRGQEIVLWNEEGEVVRVVESSEGTGTFASASALVRNPDGGFAVWDSHRSQILLLRDDGSFIEVVPVTPPDTGWLDGGLRGVLTGGRFVTLARFPFRGEPGRTDARDRFQVSLLERDGSLVLHLASLEGPPLREVRPGTYGREQLQWDPLVRVSDDRVFVLDSDKGEIRVFDSAGSPMRVIRRENPARIVTRAERERIIQRTADELEGMELREPILQELRRREWPDSAGHFSQAVARSDGRLLVAEPGPCAAGMSCWNVYGPEGDFEGSIDLDHETRPQFVTADEIGAIALVGSFRELAIRLYHIERR